MTGRRHGFSATGPAVQLSTAKSIFPFQLARFWQGRGLETVLVTRDQHEFSNNRQGTRIHRASDHRNALDRALTLWPTSLALSYAENALLRPYRAQYYRSTGRPTTEAREERFIRHFVAAPPTARAARSFNPRFVFGHEITNYGLATAMCRKIPRILFPWGGDVFLYAETSPFMGWMVGKALRSVDLVLPSSTTAARHIRDRFGVAAEKVHPLSWGIDRSMFQRADPATRERLLGEMGIPIDHRVVLSSRQFNPVWGCFETLDGFLHTAAHEPATHFVLLAGVGVEPYIAEARSRIESRGLVGRFTVLDGRVPLARVAELMSIADVFTSLMGLGDMRSASVVQAAASGGVPVISDSPEHREMKREGFSGFLVDGGDSSAVLDALSAALRPETGPSMRANNQRFIAQNEDQSVQLEKMLQLIDNICDRYAEVAQEGSR